MNLAGRTVFITGGGTGIGAGLAKALHDNGNQVIISGRRDSALKAVCAECPGMAYTIMDVTSKTSIQTAVPLVLQKFPEIDVVINNSGVQRVQCFNDECGYDDEAMLEEVNTNLVGLIRVTQKFLPHLRQRPSAIINVSSGLAFRPLPTYPIYCATKAAVHSFTESLRQQLAATSVQVVELAPPYVATDLKVGQPQVEIKATAMPLDEFVTKAMRALCGDETTIRILPS